MGWEKGRYYTRSRKVNGRVLREYIGGGEAGELAAEIDAIEREERNRERELWRAEKEEIEAFDRQFAESCNMADMIARAAMVAAGFHFRRGEWRRRRVRKNRN